MLEVPHCDTMVLCQPRQGFTPLHCALRKRATKIVQMLLEAGADPNAPTENGYTALHQAAAEGQVGYLRFILF